jgi:hypothetical protein
MQNEGEQRDMMQPTRSRIRIIGLISLGAAVLLALGAAPAAAANVTSVVGSAYGYHAFNIKLLGSNLPPTGPTPSVTLASNASNSPQKTTVSTGLVQYGPAVLFTSDQISVSTSGSLGATGSVTSSTNIQKINKATTQPGTGSEIFTADGLSSTCTKSQTSSSRITQVTNGTLQTDSGLDLNDDGDFTDPGEHGPASIAIASVPAANTAHTGHIHLTGGARDDFTVVFNEHVTNADGSLTVNAVHEYFHGPSLRGDLILGQAVCGVTVS